MSPSPSVARNTIASSSSEPLPARIMLCGIEKIFAALATNSSARGAGYRRSADPEMAFATARRTRGDGGYGFSLVLSLIRRWPGRGCSPGRYGAILLIDSRNIGEL